MTVFKMLKKIIIRKKHMRKLTVVISAWKIFIFF